jgi:hypothetical protein
MLYRRLQWRELGKIQIYSGEERTTKLLGIEKTRSLREVMEEWRRMRGESESGAADSSSTCTGFTNILVSPVQSFPGPLLHQLPSGAGSNVRNENHVPL